jgi:hypothetical protein
MSSRLLLIAIGITFLIQNEKALLCCFAITCMKKTTNKVFLKPATSSQVPQGNDGDHTTI